MMKRKKLALKLLPTLLASSALGIPSYAQSGSMSSGPVTVAVREITNEARNTWWWSTSVTRQLTNMLANELKSTAHFTIVKRQELKKVLNQQELAELGITRPSTAPKKGVMTGAKY